MVFSSTEFLFLFLPALLLFYYLPVFRNRTCKNIILLLFSIGFYAWGEPMFVFVMLFSVFINWLLAIIIDGKTGTARKAFLSVAIALDVLLLGIFKYVSFISRNISALTHNEKLVVSIALPIGISFFTFQMMSYVFDVYYGKTKVQKNILWVALYVSLFPQLIAGPIVRYSDIEKEITGRNDSFNDVSAGIKRFVYGLSKKMLLANYLAQVADNVFDYIDSPSVMLAWLGAICYTLQIYFDFSGYTDMAIGLGKMFGFHFLENFNYPYISKNVTDFWRRWHISLSSWFRDYVYIPMGGNRVTKSRWIINLFTVWLLTGIWHGANWTFVCWGLLYFVILLVEKLTGFDKKNNLLTHIYTPVVFIVAWVIFRAADLTHALKYVGCMFGIRADGFMDGTFLQYVRGTFPVIAVGILFSFPILPMLKKKLPDRAFAISENIWVIILMLVSFLEVVNATYNPFIYFNF